MDFDSIDYFTEPSIVDDPYPYFEHLRAKCPVHRLPQHNAVAVTGLEETLIVLADSETYSSAVASNGPLPPLPFIPEGADITAQIAAFRPQMVLADRFLTFDRAQHAPARSLVMGLFKPSRLRENEAKLRALSDRLIDTFIDTGHVELVRDYGVIFAGLVIADLLGVPEEDRDWIGAQFGTAPPAGDPEKRNEHNPLSFLDARFTTYIEERRRTPRGDVLTDFATAKYPDGSTPPVEELVRAATLLFAAGQDTTARLLGAVMYLLAEHPDMQQRLRYDARLIPDFIEETLRLDGPVKTAHRLVAKSTCLAGVELAAGTTVALLLGAVNRDPRAYEEPGEFRLGRPKSREHLAFGRGAHTCPGAPLARTETRVSVERLLARLGNIHISEQHHGGAGARRLHHEPSYILRGFKELHLGFTMTETG